jgi:hypothetical protein
MPYSVPIDSVGIKQNPNLKGYRITCYFSDPAGIANYYMLKLKSNDSLAINQNSVRIVNDKLTDGQQMSLTYRTSVLPGDTVIVNLQSIDASTYNFYKTLVNAQGDLNPLLSSPPANPTNNISNSGYGYFSAYSIATKSIVVQ